MRLPPDAKSKEIASAEAAKIANTLRAPIQNGICPEPVPETSRAFTKPDTSAAPISSWLSVSKESACAETKANIASNASTPHSSSFLLGAPAAPNPTAKRENTLTTSRARIVKPSLFGNLASRITKKFYAK